MERNEPQIAARNVARELGQSPDHKGVDRLAADLAAPVVSTHPAETPVRRLHTDHGYSLVRDLVYENEWHVVTCRPPTFTQYVVAAGMSLADALVYVENLVQNGGTIKAPTLRPITTKIKPFGEQEAAERATLPITSIGPSGIGGYAQTEAKP